MLSLKPEAYSLDPTRQLLEDLYRDRTLTAYSSGQGIPLYADEWMIVCRGVVQLSTVYANKNETLIGWVGSSMPLGLPLTQLEPYQAIALTDVDILRLTVAEVDHSATLAKGLLHQVMRRLVQTEKLVAVIGQRRVEDRLLGLLHLLSYEFGTPGSEGIRLNVRLTHQNLSNAIGTTRVTITRLLHRFRDQGWVKVDRQRHYVLNLPPRQHV